MNPGRLRIKAEIQTINNAQDDFGQPILEGVKFKDVYCSITPINGKESFLSNKDFAKTTHKIKIRYISGVNASMRLKWGVRIFDFTRVRDIGERTKEIEIYAEEVING